jgi:RHS repeat-associated protein
MSDNTGTTTYSYDLRDRLVTEATPIGTLNYGYDYNGNLVSIQSSTPNGTSVMYQYDALNRVNNVVDGRLSGSQSTRYSYDSVGNLLTNILPNGVTNLYQYDSLNRLKNLTAKAGTNPLGSFAYGLGSAGNRTSVTETVSSTGRNYVWSYDKLYRLTNENISASPGGSLTYGYDSVGNRTNRTGTLGSLNAGSSSFNSNDELTTDLYDANGNTTKSAGNSYGYDFENRLAYYNILGAIIAYDGDGNRVSEQVGETTIFYLVDTHNPSGHPQVLEESTSVNQGPTNLSRAYTYGLSLISQRQPGVSTNFFVYDGHGSTRLLTDMSGTNVVNAFTYDAFGNMIASNGPAQTTHLYCGQQVDPNFGLYYLRARYMNAGTGRFWTRDPLDGAQEEPLSLHRYLYAWDDPVNRTDPSGKWASKWEAPIHQLAIDHVLTELPDSDRDVLKEEQVLMDKLQLPQQAYMHAMRDGTHNQSVQEAQCLADEWVRGHLTSARAAQARGGPDSRKTAMEFLGDAMHTLQDSTSPAHHGFQPWGTYFLGDANWRVILHVSMESMDPGPGSWLYRATREAYDYFNSTAPLPEEYFNDLGVDTMGEEFSTALAPGTDLTRVEDIGQMEIGY